MKYTVTFECGCEYKDVTLTKDKVKEYRSRGMTVVTDGISKENEA